VFQEVKLMAGIVLLSFVPEFIAYQYMLS